MFRAVIIDDEASARETLTGLIKKYLTDVQVVAEADSVATGIEAIKNHQPEVVFLDIKMPSGIGFNVLEKIGQIDFAVIFTTAYDKYALKAIKFSALDYLLKPINPSELREAIQKVRQKKAETSNVKNLQLFADNIKNINQQFNKIALPGVHGLLVVEFKEIIRCEGERNYTMFYLANNRKVLVSKTLREFEELLSDFGFIRIFQSHLINFNHVKKYVRGRGGYVEMSDGSMVPVSRDKKDEFLHKLNSLF